MVRLVNSAARLFHLNTIGTVHEIQLARSGRDTHSTTVHIEHFITEVLTGLLFGRISLAMGVYDVCVWLHLSMSFEGM